jgi:hypothetical protein
MKTGCAPVPSGSHAWRRGVREPGTTAQNRRQPTCRRATRSSPVKMAF